MDERTRVEKKKKTQAATDIWEIEISLSDIKPRIWRRFAVPGNITLANLHQVIQDVMGWTNSHLHEFIVGRDHYSSHDSKMNPDWDRNSYDERLAVLRDVVKGEGAAFVYEYDFGDGWQHKLHVKKIGPPEAKVAYPVCLEGERACPPEDCGGPWAYDELLTVIADPEHERYEELTEWLGEGFDPEAFDVEETNEMLGDIR